MSLPSKQSSLALGLGSALTLFIGLFKGGAPEWASLSWVAFSGLALTALLLISLSAAKHIETSPFFFISHVIRSPFIVLIAFQLWVLLQALFLSSDLSSSLDQSLIGMGMLFYLGIWLFAAQQGLQSFSWLYMTIIGNAMCQAAYGLWVFLSGTDLLLWMPKLYYLDRPTGFFVNANHFAAYLVLSLTLCLSHTLSQQPDRTHKVTLLKSLDRIFAPKTFIIAFLLVALIASKSLGAITSLMVVTISLMLLMIWRSKQRKKWLMICAVSILLILFALLLLDYAVLERQFADISHTISRRIELSHASAGMLQDHWLTGVGSGAFYSQFSAYRDLAIGNSYYNFAHNDLIQLWIEFGLIGLLLLVLFLALALRDNVLVLQKTQSGMQATFAYASLLSTIAVVVHSIVDFPLHLPGYSVSYLIIISFNSLHRLQ